MRETLRPHCERECMTLAAAMQKGSSKGSSSSAELVRCKMRHCTRQPYHCAAGSGSNGGVRAISLHSCEPMLELALKLMSRMKRTWKKNLPLECPPQMRLPPVGGMLRQRKFWPWRLHQRNFVARILHVKRWPRGLAK